MFEKRIKEIPDDICRVWFPTEDEYIQYKSKYLEYNKYINIQKQVSEIILKWYNIAKDRMKPEIITTDFCCPKCNIPMVKKKMPMTEYELFACQNWKRGCEGFILSQQDENKINKEGSCKYLKSLAEYSWRTELRNELNSLGWTYDDKQFDNIISSFFQQEKLPTIRRLYDNLCIEIGRQPYLKSNTRSGIQEDCLYQELIKTNKYLEVYKNKPIFYTLNSNPNRIPESYIKMDVLAVANGYIEIYECKSHNGYIDEIQKNNYEKLARFLYPTKRIFFKYDYAEYDSKRYNQIEAEIETKGRNGEYK